MKRLTQEDIHKCINRLKHARKLISKGNQTYLCYALNDGCSQEDFRLAWYLQDWVMSMLKKNNRPLSMCINNWIFYTHGIRVSKRDAKKIRLKWIDWMVSELEKELA
jgi:hypothetical protein